jgi:pectinesterase
MKANLIRRTLFCVVLSLAALLISAKPAFAADATVAADGSGQYKSLQDAINAAPQVTGPSRAWVIRVKPGVYKELIYVQREKRFLSLVGDDATKTVITYNLNANLQGLDGKPIGTFRTPTVQVDADNFTAENITFENSAGNVGQALALRVDGDRAVFRNCRFLGWQDTIFLNRGRQYFENCYITGHVDFIFGGATAFFERCHIHGLKDGYITAASTPVDQPFGFVFSNCRITGEAAEVKTYLGRPWRQFASTIFINTEMSDVVRPVGWNNWGHATREKTVRYGEYNSKGAGARPSERVPWARKLTRFEADTITLENVLGGADGWNPQAKEPGEPASLVSVTAPDNCGPTGRLRKNVAYGHAGEERLLLDACVPEGPGLFPAAILVHGGGWTGGDKTKGVEPLFQPLARAGIAWFSIDYRLAPKNRHPAAVEDVESAIRWVKVHAAELLIDPRRIVLIGESAGGHLVAMAAVRAKDDTRVAAVVPFYAPVDQEADMQRRGGLSASMKALFGLTEASEASMRVLREGSPINYVHAGLPPFLLVHGTGDPSVPFDQSTRMQAKLRAAGVSVELISIDGGSHGMARWETFDPDYKKKVVTWIEQTLNARAPK